jgi:uncharacterized protein (DUF342 family)
VLLDQLLAAAGVTYGLIQDNLDQSAIPADLPRRIILAKGDPPAPDATGRTVTNQSLPRIAERIVIRIADDHLSAAALYRAGEPPTADEVRAALSRAGVTHGLDAAALAKFPGNVAKSGKLTIARGTPAKAAQPAGFHLRTADVVRIAGDEDTKVLAALVQVEPGQVLAKWSDAVPGIDGHDVLGQALIAETAKDPEPDQCAGPGTELGRDRDGDLVLRATRDGVVQRQADGVVRVVGVVNIPGDLAGDAPPVHTEDVVVVRGNVASGAVIRSSSDVVILGDVADARIDAGGHLEIGGTLGPGEDIRASGVLSAGAIEGRRILAGGCLLYTSDAADDM